MIEMEEIVNKDQPPLKLIARLRPHQGHRCFEYDKATGNIVEAEYKIASNAEEMNNVFIPTKKVVITKENCLYCMSLNKKNAKRRFTKMITELKLNCQK